MSFNKSLVVCKITRSWLMSAASIIKQCQVQYLSSKFFNIDVTWVHPVAHRWMYVSHMDVFSFWKWTRTAADFIPSSFSSLNPHIKINSQSKWSMVIKCSLKKETTFITPLSWNLFPKILQFQRMPYLVIIMYWHQSKSKPHNKNLAKLMN